MITRQGNRRAIGQDASDQSGEDLARSGFDEHARTRVVHRLDLVHEPDRAHQVLREHRVHLGGVVNFADDYSKVPIVYRSKVEEVRIAKAGPSTFSQNSSGNLNMGAQPGKTGTQVPPVAAPLTREGDFAIKLVEALKIGRAGSEEEAESILASAGIAPKNGWIADYPMTPDIIQELDKAIIEAADARKLPMGKDEALRVFRTTALELELPIIAEIPTEIPDRYAESPYPEYHSLINTLSGSTHLS